LKVKLLPFSDRWVLTDCVLPSPRTSLNRELTALGVLRPGSNEVIQALPDLCHTFSLGQIVGVLELRSAGATFAERFRRTAPNADRTDQFGTSSVDVRTARSTVA